MFFVGNATLGGRHSGDITPTNVSPVNAVELLNGIFGSLFVSSDFACDLNDLAWGNSTVLWAKFDGNLLAGNLDVVAENLSAFLIKRRRKGKVEDWVTLFSISVKDESGKTDVSKLKFERFDKYVASGVEYEFAIIPVVNGKEGGYNVREIVPKFEGIFIVTKDQMYNAIFDMNTQVQRNHPSAVVNTIASKYPFVISHSKNNYYSGNVSATFVEVDRMQCKLKSAEGYEYRKDLMDFLCDGTPKMLKTYTGETFLIAVTDNPSEERLQYTDKVTTSFNFNEIGDAENLVDLYNNGLIDINIEEVMK